MLPSNPSLNPSLKADCSSFVRGSALFNILSFGSHVSNAGSNLARNSSLSGSLQFVVYDHMFFHIHYQKFGMIKIFEILLKEVLLCSPRLLLFDQMYSKNRNVVKYNCNLKWLLIKKKFDG